MSSADTYDEPGFFSGDRSDPEPEPRQYNPEELLKAQAACDYLRVRHQIGLSPGLLRRAGGWGVGPAASTDVSDASFWTPRALDAWATAQVEASAAGWGPGYHLPIAPFFDPPKFLLVAPKGVEGDFMTEQLREWGCLVVRSDPLSALWDAKDGRLEAAVVHVDGSGLGLLVPLIARLISQCVVTVLVGEVELVPEELRTHCTDAGTSFRTFDGKTLDGRVRLRMNLSRKIHLAINEPYRDGGWDEDKHWLREMSWRGVVKHPVKPVNPLGDVEEEEGSHFGLVLGSR